MVVLSIAVGVFSIGVIAGAYMIISNDMSESYAANVPSNIELRMADFGDSTLESIRNARGVGEAEARRAFVAREVTYTDGSAGRRTAAFLRSLLETG